MKERERETYRQKEEREMKGERDSDRKHTYSVV